MKKWLTKDFCAGIFLFVFGIWWEWGARQIKINDFDVGIPPDFMPKLLGYLLLILSAVLIGKAVVEVKKGEAKSEPGENKHLIALALVGGLALFCALFEVLGFLICATLFIFAISALLCTPGEGKKKTAAYYCKHFAIALVMTMAMYLVFVKGFHIPLPTLFL